MSIFEEPDTTQYAILLLDDNLDPKCELGTGVSPIVAVYATEEALLKEIQKQLCFDGWYETVLEEGGHPFYYAERTCVRITLYYAGSGKVQQSYTAIRLPMNRYFAGAHACIYGER